MADDQSINVSQLILVVLLGGIAIRYFFFSPAQSPARNAANSASQLRAREADVERIQQMFPQISRRTIMWDLQRNGGSVAATTERILSGRGLDEVRWATGFHHRYCADRSIATADISAAHACIKLITIECFS